MMSNSNQGHIVLHALKAIFVSVLKILAIVCGWTIKLAGAVLTKIGEFTLKLAEK